MRGFRRCLCPPHAGQAKALQRWMPRGRGTEALASHTRPAKHGGAYTYNISTNMPRRNASWRDQCVQPTARRYPLASRRDRPLIAPDLSPFWPRSAHVQRQAVSKRATSSNASSRTSPSFSDTANQARSGGT